MRANIASRFYSHVGVILEFRRCYLAGLNDIRQVIYINGISRLIVWNSISQLTLHYSCRWLASLYRFACHCLHKLWRPSRFSIITIRFSSSIKMSTPVDNDSGSSVNVPGWTTHFQGLVKPMGPSSCMPVGMSAVACTGRCWAGPRGGVPCAEFSRLL